MTQQHLLELIRADYPEKGDTFLRILANQAMSDYTFETLVLRGTGSQAADGSNIRFTLPADCIRLEDVYDSDTGIRVNHAGAQQWNLAQDAEVTWWVENGKLVIGYYSASNNQFVAAPATYTWELRYRRYPTTLTSANMTTELDLPTPLHGAIEARLRERLAAGNRDLTGYWHAVYRDFVRKGKMWGNEQQDGGAFNLRVSDTSF